MQLEHRLQKYDVGPLIAQSTQSFLHAAYGSYWGTTAVAARREDALVA
jgi:hypothetical protein